MNNKRRVEISRHHPGSNRSLRTPNNVLHLHPSLDLVKNPVALRGQDNSGIEEASNRPNCICSNKLELYSSRTRARRYRSRIIWQVFPNDSSSQFPDWEDASLGKPAIVQINALERQDCKWCTQKSDTLRSTGTSGELTCNALEITDAEIWSSIDSENAPSVECMRMDWKWRWSKPPFSRW